MKLIPPGSAYKVQKISTFSFHFATDFSDGFLVEHHINNQVIGSIQIHGNVHEISFKPFGQSEKPDPLVKETIIATLVRALKSTGKDDIHYYLCDPSDGLHHQRDRMFTMWFNYAVREYDLPYDKYSFKLPAPKGDEIGRYYVSFIIHKKAKGREEFIAAVESKIQNDILPSK